MRTISLCTGELVKLRQPRTFSRFRRKVAGRVSTTRAITRAQPGAP
jgi:hypothetical protein